MNLKQSGIYQIKNLVNGKVYVGSAVNIEQRLYRHKNQLHKNKHDNKYLQRAWNKYGENTFTFEVLEIVKDGEILLTREQYWLDSFMSYIRENGYNICPTAGNSLGTTHSDETKRMIGQKSKERNATKHLQGLAPKGEDHPSAILNTEEVKIIKLLLNDGRLQLKEIGDIFGVSKSYISGIKKGRTWYHIDINQNDVLNEKYIYMILETLKTRKPSFKLTEDEAKCIKLLIRDTHISYTRLSELFGISIAQISRIVNNQRRINVIVNENDSIINYTDILTKKNINISKLLKEEL